MKTEENSIFKLGLFLIRLTLLFVICVLQFMGCSDGTIRERGQVLFYDITNGIEKDGKVYLSEIADDIETIKLETNDSILIGSIYDVKISGNYILVSDNLNHVLLFDTAGNFLRKIGNKGNGPGEYLTTSGILLNDLINRIYIWDGGRNYILEYELNSGGFLIDHKLDFALSEFNFFNDSTFIFVCSWPGLIYSDNCMLHLISTDFKKYEKILCFPDEFCDAKANSPWGFVEIYKHENKIYFWESNSDTIKSINPQLAVTPEFCISLKNKYKVPKRIKTSEESYDGLKGEHLKIDGFIETTNFIFIDGIQEKFMKSIFYNKEDSTCLNIVFNYDIRDKGFHNDLDGGIPFWPSGQISRDVLYATMSPFELKKLIEQPYLKTVPIKLKNRSIELLKLLDEAQMTDNPFIFLVTLKNN